jgi:hypothetical protein
MSVKSKPKQAAITPKVDEELDKLEKETNEKLESIKSGQTKDTGEEQTPAEGSAPKEIEAPTEEVEVAESPEPQGEGETASETSDEEILSSLKDKGQRRFRELSKRAALAAELEKRVKALEQLVGKQKPLIEPVPEAESESVQPTGLPWDESLEPREVYEEEYNQEIESKASQKAEVITRQQLKDYHEKMEDLQTLQRDLDIVETEFDELNPGKRDAVTNEVVEPNPDYDQELAIKIATWFKERRKANPTLRLVEFVRDLMSLRNKGTEQGRREASAEVVRQAASQPIVPSGTPTGGSTSLDQMISDARSMRELDEVEKSLPHA